MVLSLAIVGIYYLVAVVNILKTVKRPYGFIWEMNSCFNARMYGVWAQGWRVTDIMKPLCAPEYIDLQN